jgi:hypothetical protein
MITEQDKQRILEKRNEIGRCPCCTGNIKDRTISLYKGLTDAMYRVYTFLGSKRSHEFKMGEIKHLLGKNEYARFGDLVRFGGIVYKPKIDGKSKKAFYGLNMARAKEFFSGERKIPVQITLNQITNEIVSQVEVYYWEIPSLRELIKKDGLYDHEKKVTVDHDVPAVSRDGKIIKRPKIVERNGRQLALFD